MRVRTLSSIGLKRPQDEVSNICRFVPIRNFSGDHSIARKLYRSRTRHPTTKTRRRSCGRGAGALPDRSRMNEQKVSLQHFSCRSVLPPGFDANDLEAVGIEEPDHFVDQHLFFVHR